MSSGGKGALRIVKREPFRRRCVLPAAASPRRWSFRMRERANGRVLAEIRTVHVENDARRGSPPMLHELRDRGMTLVNIEWCV
jgi:hypothetical protein